MWSDGEMLTMRSGSAELENLCGAGRDNRDLARA